MTYPYRQARWFTPSTLDRGIWWIVLHCPQFPERLDAAERLADYFATTGRKASTHAVCDADSLWECVRDKDVAFGAGGANRHGLHIEIAGYAEQTRAQWLDPYSEAAMRQAAGWVRAKAALYGVPLRFVNANGLRAGNAGITTHAECELAFPSTGHTDPGGGFPIDHFLGLLTAEPTEADEEMLLWS